MTKMTYRVKMKKMSLTWKIPCSSIGKVTLKMIIMKKNWLNIISMGTKWMSTGMRRTGLMILTIPRGRVVEAKVESKVC